MALEYIGFKDTINCCSSILLYGLTGISAEHADVLAKKCDEKTWSPTENKGRLVYAFTNKNQPSAMKALEAAGFHKVVTWKGVHGTSCSMWVRVTARDGADFVVHGAEGAPEKKPKRRALKQTFIDLKKKRAR